MNTINYMWNFKPNETNSIDTRAIHHNKNYGLQYKILKPNDIEPLVPLYSDKLNKLWKYIPNWIIKADLGRLLYIYFNGNLYFDIDCFVQKDIKHHFNNCNILLFTEHISNSVNDLGPLECKNPENVLRIANFAFGAKVKKHPFLKEVIDECINRLGKLVIYSHKNRYNPSHTDILWVCGPDNITTIFHKSKKKYDDILLLDNSYLNHRCYGSWR